MCDPISMMVMTAASGVASGAGALQAGKAGAAANARNSAEMQKQIDVAEIQSTNEALDRTYAARQLASGNLAAAASSGALSSSASFENIQRQNAEVLREDLSRIGFNEANTKGQLSAQQREYDLAGHAAKQQGYLGALTSGFRTISGIYENAPRASIGVVGRSTNNVNGGPLRSSLRPKARPNF